MSLLLEALKKAELAKQQVNRSADPTLDGEQGLSLEPRESIITREELPAITPSIEITQEDTIQPAHSSAPEPQFSTTTTEPLPVQDPPPLNDMAPVQEPPAVEEVMPVGAPASSSQTDQHAARQLFDVKEVDYNPRRPFYITLAVLGLAAVSYGGYLWWQLQPRSLVNTNAVKNPSKGAPESPPPVAEAPQQPQPSQADAPPAPQSPQGTNTSAPNPTAPAQNAVTPATARAPGQSTAQSPATGSGQEPVAKGPAVSRGGQSQAERTNPAPSSNASTPPIVQAPARAATRTSRPPRAPITVNPPTVQPDEYLEQAYDAYQKGDLVNAKEQYLKVLQREPSNRDALLGLAAIDLRTGNIDTAEARYLKLLELDPRDTVAQSGLISLRGGSGDPVQTESRLKTLIANHPDATHLQFTLGNQYAIQGRWREAQDSYFKAYSAEPENPDFAFNLAISLDQLRQPRLAAEDYRRALALATKRPAAFDAAKVKARLAELER